MPIFEFKCDICGNEFERLVFRSDDNRVTCPSCGSDKTRKEFSVFACAGTDKQSGTSCGPSSSGGFS